MVNDKNKKYNKEKRGWKNDGKTKSSAKKAKCIKLDEIEIFKNYQTEPEGEEKHVRVCFMVMMMFYSC